MVRYRFADLVLDSEIDLPLRHAPVEAPATVTIRRGAVPERLDGALITSERWDFSPDSSLFRCGPGAPMRVMVRQGREIVIEGGVLVAQSRAFLVGTVMGILLHQRGEMVLHAASLEIGGGAVLVLGDSGAGKSVCAAALAAAGHALLSDDLCLVRHEGGKRFLAHSDARPLKVDAEAADALGLRRLDYVEDGEIYVEVPQAKDPLPILALAVLDGFGPARLDRLALTRSLACLRRFVFRPEVPAYSDRESDYFRAAAALAQAVPVFAVTRPRGLGHLDETVALLRQAASGTIR